jgi:hypothetical protein
MMKLVRRNKKNQPDQSKEPIDVVPQHAIA